MLFPTNMNLDQLFRYEFNNGNPVELQDLAESMMALAAEYRGFAAKAEDPAGDGDAKLYIKEIRSGSVIADLVPWAIAAIPFVENFNIAVQFGQNLSSIMQWLLTAPFHSLAPEGEQSVDKQSLENISQILEPVAKDPQGRLNLGIVNHGNMTVNISINSAEANAIQNSAKRRLQKEVIKKNGLHEKVVMYWQKTTADPGKCAGDRAIIESISRKGVKTVAPSEIKALLMGGPDNPFRYAYIVDVEVETVRDLPVLYKVLSYHDSIPLTPNSDA